MSRTDRTAMAAVAGACVVCCLPLIVAAGPVVAAVDTGAAAHVARRTERKRDAAASDNP